MKRLLVVAAVLGLTGCVQPVTSASPTPPSPSPSAASRPFAVMVHRAGLGEPYIVQLVSPTGQGGPWVSPMARSEKIYYFPSTSCVGPIAGGCAAAETAAYNLPEVSISKTHVYFLDGETLVKSLSPDGTVQTVMNLSAPANSQVVFAVSPDDKRIAVAVITLATSRVPDSFHNVVYVEDVGTSANRVDIYSSTTLAQWPVAWRGRSVVVGVGSTDIAYFDNPYGATSYRIVQDATGLQEGLLRCAAGLLVPAGTACATWCQGWTGCANATLGKQGWDASETQFATATNPALKIVIGWTNGADLSPDGKRIAAANLIDQQGTVETRLFGAGSTSSLSMLGAPQGWLSNSLVVVGSTSNVWIVDADKGATIKMTGLQTIPAQGMSALAGVLPTNLT